MRSIGKTEVTLFLIGCGAIALLLGGYLRLSAKIEGLENQTHAFESRLAAAEQNHKTREREPAAQARHSPDSVLPIPVDAAPPPAQIADRTAAPNNAATAQPRTKSLAEAVAETVVCVDKNTHTQVPCERAASCLGLKSFDVTYFNGLRTKLGISSPMLICNMKPAEGDAVPAGSQ